MFDADARQVFMESDVALVFLVPNYDRIIDARQSFGILSRSSKSSRIFVSGGSPRDQGTRSPVSGG